MRVARKTLVSFALSIACSAPIAQAEWGPLHEISEFDLGGVKTGMGVDDAISALKNYYSISDTDIEFLNYRGIDEITGIENPPNSFTYTTQDFSIEAKILPRIPLSESRPFVVYSIRYELPEQEGAKKRLLENAIEKYGEPSALNKFSASNWRFHWCTEHDDSAYRCADNTINLTLSHTSLTLEDYTYMIKLQEYVEQEKQEELENQPKLKF